MFTDSKTVQRINRQCQVWIQKTTGKRCSKGLSNGAVTYMHPLSGPPICVTDEELNNASIWSKA
jgi:hypothetical protein